MCSAHFRANAIALTSSSFFNVKSKMSQSRPHSRSQPEVQRPSTSPNAVDSARRLATSPSNDTAQSNPPVNQDNAEPAEPREASQDAPVAEILQVFHVAYLILPILILVFSYAIVYCFTPYFWLTYSSIARPVMAAILNFSLPIRAFNINFP